MQKSDGGGSANSSDVLVATQREAPERIVEQSVNVVVPPIMEGISAVEQTTPHEHVQEREVEQSVNVVVSPIKEGISAVEQITPHRYSSLTRTRWTSLLGCSDRCLLSQEIPHVHYIERISDLKIVLSRQVGTIREVRKTVKAPAHPVS